MKLLVVFLVAASALTIDAKIKGAFGGPGGPPMGMGPPPFVQAIIANKGTPGAPGGPFVRALGPMGMGMGGMAGPPPFVQSMMAAKAPGGAGMGMGMTGIPPFVQELMSAKGPMGMGAGVGKPGMPPFVQSMIGGGGAMGMGPMGMGPMGPGMGIPPFVQDMIASKNAAKAAFPGVPSMMSPSMGMSPFGGSAPSAAALTMPMVAPTMPSMGPPAWVQSILDAREEANVAAGLAPSTPTEPSPYGAAPVPDFMTMFTPSFVKPMMAANMKAKAEQAAAMAAAQAAAAAAASAAQPDAGPVYAKRETGPAVLNSTNPPYPYPFPMGAPFPIPFMPPFVPGAAPMPFMPAVGPIMPYWKLG